MSLSVITLAMNNVAEVRRTLASVVKQIERPDYFLVFDGSTGSDRSDIEQTALAAGATYHWAPPKGVYPAMNEALTLVPENSHVWFVNSSDWLSSPRSVSLMRSGIGSGEVWLIGGLHRYQDRLVSQHPIASQGEDLLHLMNRGLAGFAHPAAVISRQAIDQCGGFDESVKFASDYGLALQLGKRFGPPGVIPETVAIHNPQGLTSRHLVRHAIEKAQFRSKLGFPARHEARVIFATFLRHLSAKVKSSTVPELPGETLVHFCSAKDAREWPECCVIVLDNWAGGVTQT